MPQSTLNIQVVPGVHGGASMYEFGEQEGAQPTLVFSGNLDEMTAYFRARLGEIIVPPAREQREEPRRVLGPPPAAADAPRAPQSNEDWHKGREEFKDRPRALNPKVLRDDLASALDEDLRG